MTGTGSNDAGVPGKQHPSDWIFDDAQLRTYHLTIAKADWDKLQATAGMETYVPANLKVDDQIAGRIHVRYKGAHGTLTRCLSGGKVICKKMSLKLDFNREDENKKFFGLKKLNLHSQVNDPTHLHERLGYELYRKMGFPAPRSVHARVMLNGAYAGVYAITEQVDGRFTDYHFPKGDGDGNLYKESWLGTYRDQTSYEKLQKTNEMVVPATKIARFASALHGANPVDGGKLIDTWMKGDDVLMFMAIDRAITHWDGPMTFYCWNGNCGNHNFYVYESAKQDRISLVPWDFDYTFEAWSWWDRVGPWNKPPADCAQRFTVLNNSLMNPGCNLFFRALATLGETRYQAAISKLLAGPFETSLMRARLDAWAAQLDKAVMEDANGPGHPRWKQAVDNFRRDLSILRSKMEAIRAGKTPWPIGLAMGQVMKFDGVDPLGFLLGTRNGGNPETRAERSLFSSNSENPALGGSHDARLAFTINPTGVTPGYATFSIGLTESFVDLRAATRLRISLRADRSRRGRIELSSRFAPAMPLAGRAGWDITLSETASTPSLEISALNLPGNVSLPPELRNSLLQQTSGFSVVVYGDRMNADTGSLVVDNIELMR